MTQYLMIGEILKPQGIRGEAKVKPYAANHDDFRRWKTLYLAQGEGYAPIQSQCVRVHDGFVYLLLEGCERPEDVERLRGKQLFIDRAHANALAEDETYITDLIGCEAVDERGVVIGTLTDVLQHGVVDVYVFRTAKGSLMAPALKAVFPQVDVAARRILVDASRLDEVAVREE